VRSRQAFGQRRSPAPGSIGLPTCEADCEERSTVRFVHSDAQTAHTWRNLPVVDAVAPQPCQRDLIVKSIRIGKLVRPTSRRCLRDLPLHDLA